MLKKNKAKLKSNVVSNNILTFYASLGIYACVLRALFQTGGFEPVTIIESKAMLFAYLCGLNALEKLQPLLPVKVKSWGLPVPREKKLLGPTGLNRIPCKRKGRSLYLPG